MLEGVGAEDGVPETVGGAGQQEAAEGHGLGAALGTLHQKEGEFVFLLQEGNFSRATTPVKGVGLRRSITRHFAFLSFRKSVKRH